jgi:hypothetical protein
MTAWLAWEEAGSRYNLSPESWKPAAVAEEATFMATLAELKHRQYLRKMTNAPIVKILGPDQAEQDVEWLLSQIDSAKQLLLEAALYIEQTEQSHDAVTTDLITRMKSAAE